MKPKTKLQEQVLEVLNDIRFWKAPSSRTIAKVLKKKGHHGVEIALKGLIKGGYINKNRVPE